MNSKICAFLVIFSIIIIIPSANAQISIGEKAEQKSIEITLSSEGEVDVKHVIRSSDLPVDLELINGTISNLRVTDEEGKEKIFSINNDSIVLIQPSEENSIVKYNLKDVLFEKDGIWTWNFLYLESTSFILPEGIDLVFVNERPVFLGDMKGINCHGCQMLLEYPTKEIKIFENVKWEDEEFLVKVSSNSYVEGFVFDQPSKSITFDVSDENRFVNTIIPLELLWEPYTVFLDDEKILSHQYINNGTHVWINIKPDTSGQVSIIGTTVVPEFPIIAPLAIGFLIILVLPLMKKFNLH